MPQLLPIILPRDAVDLSQVFNTPTRAPERLPPWLPPQDAADDWQTSAWEQSTDETSILHDDSR